LDAKNTPQGVVIASEFTNLPRLAIYMGHVSIVSTAHYLHFVPAMRQLASDRFELAFGDVVEEVSA
jgi:integrase/recombinase XerD